MSFYLLDTNICIFLINQRQGFERIVWFKAQYVCPIQERARQGF